MRLADFDYSLPQELIATHPTSERSASRLLSVDACIDSIEDRLFRDLPSLLQTGDLLVLNDTRVIHARLHGHKRSGGKVEILIERIDSDTNVLAQIKASKSPRPGVNIDLPGGCTAIVLERKQDLFLLQFGTAIGPYLEQYGEVPLPPYLGRDAESADDERYQTVYAASDGAVAAPTAGLHFDQGMLQAIGESGVRQCFITLHVGAGTFQSLRNDEVGKNRLHSERVEVCESVCEAVRETRANGGRVVAVGTTSVRALETAASGGAIQPIDGETELFILPGYRFQAVDAMLTNFHLPQSSLLMLVAAFAGRSRMLAAYRHAVCEKYRFFSYGDAMFIVPPAEHKK